VDGLFSLGGAGLAVNAFAVAYGALMAINIGWPRNELYGAGNYMWGGIIFIVAALVIGGIYYGAVGKHSIGVLDTHRVEEPELAPQAFGGP